ncbi:Polyribonucleotide nucleotidyltransferase [Paenibacillus sp. P1XP2]|nr:Polyribonucleotide nucleotidyltransferase [Paenibacillus sp. P1XP2]
MVVSGTKDAIMMVEAEANEVPEEVMLEAIMFGHEEIKKIVEVIEELVAKAGKPKMEVKLHTVDAEVNKQVREYAAARLVEAVRIAEKHARQDAIDAINDETVAYFEQQYIETPELLSDVKEVLHDIVKEEVRRLITHDKVRPDGRKLDEIRPIECDTGILPRTHGTGLFTRGQTQALSVCTLGALGDVQILDGIDLQESKRFMHHYNFPPFSVGEAARSALRDAVKSAMARLAKERCRRSFLPKPSFRTRSVLCPRCWNPTAPLPRQAFAQARWP